MIRRILLALGNKFYADIVIRRGIELAKRHQAALTAVTVLDMEFWKGGWSSVTTASEAMRRMEGRPWEAAQRRRDELAAQFTSACESAGVTHRLIHPESDPLNRLAAEARHHDLLVFGLRGFFDQSIVPDPEGVIAWLIRHHVSPIIAAASEYREIRRVMVAYSGTHQSANALRRFVQMRPWPEAEVQLVTLEKDPAAADQLLSEADEYCRAHDIQAERLCGQGSARANLLPMARQHRADLIVLADGYRSLMLHNVLGDLTRDVIRHADRPLFLTH